MMIHCCQIEVCVRLFCFILSSISSSLSSFLLLLFRKTESNGTLMPIGRRCKVCTLRLLDVSSAVQDDLDGAQLVRRVEDEIFTTACHASSLLHPSPPSADEVIAVQRQVLKYLQTKDKYMALASMLFKSQAFHEILERRRHVNLRHPKAVVDLPRTASNKPYIPISRCHSCNLAENKEDIFPISISHQYPFVGMASIEEAEPEGDYPADSAAMPTSHHAIHNDDRPWLVGLDIVVFDVINPRLYASEDEFLEVFRESFTDNEWTAIQNAPPLCRMQDFYIRWAMKEAYTKAIGVGMGLDFRTFEVVLDGLSWQSSISECMKRSGGNSKDDNVELKGKLRFLNPDKSNADEHVDFFFVPLFGGGGAAERPSNLGTREGCACICVRPFSGGLEPNTAMEQNDNCYLSLNIVWTDLEQLIKFHS